MDIKTMEWMEERLKQGKELQEKINTLKWQKESARKATAITFSANEKMVKKMKVRIANGYDFGKNVIKETLEVFQKLATEEIDRLEKEFAEL